jgi:transcriptional regulator with XRE-family HTH domain
MEPLSNMSPTRSVFATTLTKLLDETNLFNRREWSEFLNVSQPAVSQWVNDKTIPEPDLLQMILRVLRESDGVPREPLDDFEALMVRPFADISPHGTRLDPTLGDYLLRPLLKGFFRLYDPLPANLKREVLNEASQLCRALRGRNSGRNPFDERPEPARPRQTTAPKHREPLFRRADQELLCGVGE